MVLITEIRSLITKIIDDACNTSIFTNKCRILASVLDELKNEITKLKKNIESKQEELRNLEEHLKRLSNIINSFQRGQFFFSFLTKKQTFQEIIDSINCQMNEINTAIQFININKSFNLPKDDDLTLYKDLDQIDEFLADTHVLIQQRRKEISETMKQIHQTKGSKSLSTDEENIEALKGQPEYQLSKSDFLINEEKIDHNDEFLYYKGIKKSNNQNVTILKLIDNRIFKRLLAVLVTINHPYVETFIGAYIEDKQITIVTDRDGARLKNLLSSHTEKDLISLEKGDRTILAFKIAQAMSYLHSRSVIHRNLNSSHIFITKPLNDENQPEIQPKIVGFRDSCIQKSESTIDIEKLDTPKLSFFKAPELDESQSFDEKVDVFAFAGVLYELITDQLPFRNESASSVSDLVKRNKRPPLPENTPIELKKMIEKCWSSDPNERYSFDKIINKMIKNRIIFRRDMEKQEMIEKFYEKNSIKNISAKKSLDILESINIFIGKAYKYRYEFLSVRKVIKTYPNMLKSKFTSKYELNSEEKELMEGLIDDLTNLLTVLSNQTEEKWNHILKGSKKSRNLLSHLNITEVTNQISIHMKNIYDSMIKLGLEDAEEYKEKEDDLVFDYDELQSLFEEYEETIGADIVKQKLKDIESFRNERKLDVTISKKSLFNRINDLFAPFAKEYAVNRDDIEKYYDNRYFITKYKEEDFERSQTYLYLLGKQIRYFSRLKHKYIAEFIRYSISKEDNSVWFVTRRVPNGSLFHSIVTENKFSGEEKTKIAFKIAEAMYYIHQQRVLHLDLNSENVLIDGNQDPKIINFNFNKSKKKSELKNNLISICTLNYMAPEIIRGDNYDSKADVFSFALLLYELYTGKRPFYQFGNHSEILKKKMLSGVDLKFGSDIQFALRHLIEDGCQMDSNKRPAFKEIINRMRNENILFPGSNEDRIKSFYAEEVKSMEIET